MLLGIDDHLLATQPLDDKWAMFDWHAKPIYSDPAPSDVDVEVL